MCRCPSPSRARFGANGLGRFGPGCYVEFPGAAVDSLYTHTNVYTLLVDKQQAQRIPFDATLPTTSGAPVAYRETTMVEKELKYSVQAPNGDPWYEKDILAYTKPVYREFPIDVDTSALEGAEAVLHVDLWGITYWPASPDHHVVVALNGVTLAERTFDGVGHVPIDVAIPRGVLQRGSNILRVTVPGDTGVKYDMVAVNRYGVSFDRAFIARAGELTFAAAGPLFEVRGLSGPVVAYRRLQNQPITRLNPLVKGVGAEQLVRVPGSRWSGTYSVVDGSGLITPRLVRDPGATVTLAGKADLLIIAHSNFVAAVEKYAASKAASGLRVKLVDVQAAYDTYGGGIVGPQGIRTLIAQAAQKMDVTAVLLVGGDTYDYFNYTGAGSLSFIPSPYARTGPLVAFAPVDPLYGDLDGDQVPDIAVGRWPVRTLEELDAVIAKSLAFAARTDTPWALLAADSADGSYSFRGESETFSTLLPPTWGQSKAYADTLGIAGARAAILDALNAGPTFANWIGHSSYAQWSFAPLFTTANAATLRNADTPFVVTQWGCWNTYHVLPSRNTLGHVFLLSPARGAAAVIGPSTLTAAEADRALGQLLLPALLTPGTSIGQALVQAKQDLAATDPQLVDVILGVTLLGDPTLIVVPATTAKAWQ